MVYATFAPPFNTRYTVFDSEELSERVLELYESIYNNRGERHVNERYLEFDWNIIAGKWAAMLEAL